MIINSSKINITDKNFKYITQWIDENGNFCIDKYVRTGRVILNKDMTGCGFTTYCIKNSDNMIIVSPRVRLINNKIQQEGGCFYYNREINKYTSMSYLTEEALVQKFIIYKQQQGNKPLKIFVTYDSFYRLADMLEKEFRYNINQEFRIAIDESQCLIKDVKMKEYCNKSVLSAFINRLFKYENLLFASATPINEYVCEIPEFKQHPISLVELEWAAKEPVVFNKYSCKSALDAFGKIFDNFIKSDDGTGMHYFDAIYLGKDKTFYSYEAVIFLNSVEDICKIMSKFIKNGLINPKDVTIICADNMKNDDKLHKVSPHLHIAPNIPTVEEPHTTWTFATRTAFEGVDFYSKCASSYVFANYNVESLSLDIVSDIPQIVGRQRLACNLFRNTLHIYVTNAREVPTREAFEKFQKEKKDKTQLRINTFNMISGVEKQAYLEDMTKRIEDDPNWLYLRTYNGILEINDLIIISEQYCQDILNNRFQLYVTKGLGLKNIEYHAPTLSFKKELYCCCNMKECMRIAHKYFYTYPEAYMHQEFYIMLRFEGHNKVAYYLSSLSLDRIYACGYNTTKMDNEIKQARIIGTDSLSSLVSSKFCSGQVYTRAEVKEILQDLFVAAGLNKTAKASLLPTFVNCKECKKGGMKAYRIV